MEAVSSRCIFCKRDSRDSVSVEHILPESLGNKEHTLPRTVVCDRCNNYFSTSIERPVLESGQFVIARFNSVIPSKKDRMPTLRAILLPGLDGQFHTTDVSPLAEGGLVMDPDTDEAVEAVASGKVSRMIFPASGSPPAQQVFARFLAKVAVESMADRLIANAPQMLADFIDDDQVDRLRNFARYGKTGFEWPYHERSLYPADFVFPADTKSGPYETLHEWTFLYTDQTELYFVIAILGIEYAMNMAGASIEGYRRWLQTNSNKSPLYP
jgi:hypothetical protein